MLALESIEQAHRRPQLPAVKSGDSVRVHQVIREGTKQRVQIFDGVVIRTHRLGSLSAVITVRRIASGVGVEKTFILHSPNLKKVEVVRRGKVRRNYLSYLRQRRGKSARLRDQGFDHAAVNAELLDPTAAADDAASDDREVDKEEKFDRDLTEIDTGAEEDVEVEPTEPLGDVTKDESKAAEADQPDDTGTDEQQLAQTETEEGVSKADSKS